MAKTYPWGGFANGCIPQSLLTTVRGEYFELEAAKHLVLLEAAFQSHFGKPAIILQGYRALGRSTDMAPAQPTQWGYYNLYRTTDPLRAAYPSTSPHGYARSADFASGVDQYGSQEKDWMNANAPTYGWFPTGDSFPRREAWHFDYIPGRATSAAVVAAVQDVVIINNVAQLVAAPAEEEEDMGTVSFVPDAKSATIWIVSGINGNRVGLGSPYHMSVCQRALRNNGGDKMLAVEIDAIYKNYLTLLNSGLWSQSASLPTLDTVKLADAVVAALKAADITTTADPTKLAPVLDAAFTRSLAAIAKQTSDATVTALGFDQAKLSSSIADALKANGVVAKVDQAAVENAVSNAISRALAAMAKAQPVVEPQPVAK